MYRMNYMAGIHQTEKTWQSDFSFLVLLQMPWICCKMASMKKWRLLQRYRLTSCKAAGACWWAVVWGTVPKWNHRLPTTKYVDTERKRLLMEGVAQACTFLIQETIEKSRKKEGGHHLLKWGLASNKKYGWKCESTSATTSVQPKIGKPTSKELVKVLVMSRLKVGHTSSGSL